MSSQSNAHTKRPSVSIQPKNRWPKCDSSLADNEPSCQRSTSILFADFRARSMPRVWVQPNAPASRGAGPRLPRHQAERSRPNLACKQGTTSRVSRPRQNSRSQCVNGRPCSRRTDWWGGASLRANGETMHQMVIALSRRC